ncbi:hypothetical protein CP967_06965 [Streptomyces nitrosporeus]|uniref:Uncharacterized protein n=1 Tax=Streptomyces nitrosporeus TaxID=28894 RepID=A0A5J6F9Q2_9ACTN|nr:hypothetical protein [Streptomyces nitrosporeus]QEU71735.1 hypothetical protein CP967_06965 [Streptomyces nitrosporeus]GGY94706.1 hypothetical protein GCM10010327_26730 [Streptomyces nitrosporeus]
MAYRYWCGECRHRSPWLREYEIEQAHTDHYVAEHPRIAPEGRIESNGKNSEGASGYLLVLVVLALLLILPAVFQR